MERGGTPAVNAEHAFQLLNALVLPWWAVWLAVPRSRWAVRLSGQCKIIGAEIKTHGDH